MYVKIRSRLSATISGVPGKKKVCIGRRVLGTHQQLQFATFYFPFCN
jgi:hypothetical protein